MNTHTYNIRVLAGMLIVILLSGCSNSSSDTTSSATKKTNAVFPIKETGANTLCYSI